MGFPDRLKEARSATDLNGQALGNLLGVSKSTISHWENGRYEPSLAQLTALCEVLKVSADWLLEREKVKLSAEALQEAQHYEQLGPEEKRKWRTMRLTMFSASY
jgi:transcriptional regulator with XRE-family HTH domain